MLARRQWSNWNGPPIAMADILGEAALDRHLGDRSRFSSNFTFYHLIGGTSSLWPTRLTPKWPRSWRRSSPTCHSSHDPDLQLLFGPINKIYAILSRNSICLNLRAFGCKILAWKILPVYKKWQIWGMGGSPLIATEVVSTYTRCSKIKILLRSFGIMRKNVDISCSIYGIIMVTR